MRIFFYTTCQIDITILILHKVFPLELTICVSVWCTVVEGGCNFMAWAHTEGLVLFDIIYDNGTKLEIEGFLLPEGGRFALDDVPIRKWHHICIELNQEENYVSVAMNGLMLANKLSFEADLNFPRNLQVVKKNTQ